MDEDELFEVADLDYYRMAAAQAEVGRLEELSTRLRVERQLTDIDIVTAKKKLAGIVSDLVKTMEAGGEFKVDGEFSISEDSRTVYRTRIKFPATEE